VLPCFDPSLTDDLWRTSMNASLGEIALNHAITHDEGPVAEVLLDNVDGAREAVHAHEHEKADGPKSERRAADPRAEGKESSHDSSTADEKTSGRTFRVRAAELVEQLEEMTRENPRKALAVAAGAGLVLGVSMLSIPVLRTVAKRAAAAALAGGTGSSVASKVGAKALDKLEEMFRSA
jgi:ElaB/YqjD/DUF883 family membrane-anchored ribosome-binding protein